MTMNEEFARKIYETIVEEGGDMYKSLYDNTKITKKLYLIGKLY